MGNKLPEKWSKVQLGEICTKPQYGWTSKAKNEGRIKYLRTTDISRGGINWFQVPFCETEPKKVEKYELYKNDILISRAGSVGLSIRIHKIPQRTIFASYLIRLKTITVEPKFVEYFLKSNEYWNKISDDTAGIAIPNVNASKISRIEIPLPSLPEQKRIVAKLDALMERINHSRKRLERIPILLRRFRQAVLNAAVTGELTREWREKNFYKKYNIKENFQSIIKFIDEIPENWIKTALGNIADVTMGQSPPGASYNEKGEGIPLINGPVEFGSINPFSKTKKIKFTTKPTKICDEGDLLICVRGSTTGRLNIAGFRTCIGRGVAAINTKKIEQWYLNIFMSLQYERILNLGTGSTFPNISKDFIETYEVSIPPLEEQKEIVRQVDELFNIADEIESRYKQAKSYFDKLPQAILAKAFRGELVPQDPSDPPASELLQKIRDKKKKITG
jgi:type I restriction enzyme S subunit